MTITMVSPNTQQAQEHLWKLVNPFDATDGPVTWYYGTAAPDDDFPMWQWTYPFIDPASLPGFISTDHPVNCGAAVEDTAHSGSLWSCEASGTCMCCQDAPATDNGIDSLLCDQCAAKTA